MARPVAPFTLPDAREPQTMVYTVDLGDGTVAEVEGPPNATPEQLQSFVAAAKPTGGATPDPETQAGFADELPPQPVSKMSPEDEAQVTAMLKAGATAEQVNAFASERGFQFRNIEDVISARDKGVGVANGIAYDFPEVETDALNSGARGFADTVLMGTLPKLGAIGEGIQGAVNGQGFGDAYNRALDRNNATIAADEEQHPWARVAGQLLGGFVLPAGLEGVGLKAGTDVLRAGGTMAEARAAVGIAVRNRMALVGGGYGAAHGAGSADTLPDAAFGAAIEGGLGAATGGLFGQAGKYTKAEQRVADTVSDGADVMQAAQRQKIDPLPADVGGPATRRLTSAFAQSPAGAGSIVSASQRVIAQGKAARDRAGASVGAIAQPEAAGEAAISGAKSFIKASASRIGNVYETAGRMAGNIRLPLPNAKAALDEQIARLKEVPGGGNGLQEALSLRADLEGDFTVQGIRDMRTEMFVAPDFRGTPVERRMRQIVDAAASDIEDGLVAAGKVDAARAFSTADRQWKERLTTIERVLEPIIGKGADRTKSGEDVVKALQRAASGNGIRLEKFLGTLPEAERSIVRASLIGRMGQAAAGRQDAAGEAFSLDQFLTDWNKIGERSKNSIFGAESRAALNDLARVAQGSKEASGYANRSNTGGALAGIATGATAMFDIKTLGATLALQYGAGKLLASPKVARWLARAPKTSLSREAYVERLSRIARSEPAIANEVLSLQARLAEAFGASAPARLAAEKRDDRAAVGNGQQPENETPSEGAQP